MDLNTLYRTVIMDNYKNPKNKGLKHTDDFPPLIIRTEWCVSAAAIRSMFFPGRRSTAGSRGYNRP